MKYHEIHELIFSLTQSVLAFPQINKPTAKSPEWYDQWASQQAVWNLENALQALEKAAEMVQYNNQMNNNQTLDIEL